MTRWTAEMLVATSLLIALVMVLRRPVARHFGARAAYALWLAPLARFLLPPLIAPVEVPLTWVETSEVAAAVIAPAGDGVPLATLLVGLWLGGALLFMIAHALAYYRFIVAALDGATALTAPGIDDAAILASDAVSGPAASGLFARRIFVPRDFTTAFARDERRLALWHEALHHRRGDLWASTMGLLCLALHWFNPLAYIAHRAFRRDLEAACDADLLARAGRESREAYARTILRCVARPVPHPICALTETDELKGRIKMLNHDHGPVARTFGKSIAAAVTAGGLLLALPALAAPQAAAAPDSSVKIISVVSGEKSDGVPPNLQKCVDEANPSLAPGAPRRTNPPVRILLCDRSGAAKAPSAEAFEKALSQIESNEQVPADKKAQIVTALKARIAEMRAGN